jgi:hypothetical protein
LRGLDALHAKALAIVERSLNEDSLSSEKANRYNKRINNYYFKGITKLDSMPESSYLKRPALFVELFPYILGAF